MRRGGLELVDQRLEATLSRAHPRPQVLDEPAAADAVVEERRAGFAVDAPEPQQQRRREADEAGGIDQVVRRDRRRRRAAQRRRDAGSPALARVRERHRDRDLALVDPAAETLGQHLLQPRLEALPPRLQVARALLQVGGGARRRDDGHVERLDADRTVLEHAVLGELLGRGAAEQRRVALLVVRLVGGCRETAERLPRPVLHQILGADPGDALKVAERAGDRDAVDPCRRHDQVDRRRNREVRGELLGRGRQLPERPRHLLQPRRRHPGEVGGVDRDEPPVQRFEVPIEALRGQRADRRLVQQVGEAVVGTAEDLAGIEHVTGERPAQPPPGEVDHLWLAVVEVLGLGARRAAPGSQREAQQHPARVGGRSGERQLDRRVAGERDAPDRL